ncbi:nitrite reductase (NADH) small subunit [Hamadaea flava]|uniref:Nitrite reductase small subunit NirD n=1 Tax=Hamadaea flava TaxID=1742688 RepID=A0ABV8LFS1_9ACTN|nr:nitrite reductase small subunit NirD [Hamadaea flava]MCP2326506.1 nitrite reductase (NADH) small subunit [Hamadaea flava]
MTTAFADLAVWTPICSISRLEIERGVAALVEGVPVAIFRTFTGDVYAVDNVDPFSGASVLSRGIVGTRGDVPTVASPMHKQAFDLRTGDCLDDPTMRVRAWAVRVRDGVVEIGEPLAASVPA